MMSAARETPAMDAFKRSESPNSRVSGLSMVRWETPGRDEALARLEFLVERQHRLGLLLGPAGSGKSALARQFISVARRAACDTAFVHLLGLDAAETLWTLAAQFGARPGQTMTKPMLWRALADRLSASRFERRRMVLVLDEIEHAGRDVVDVILRLLGRGAHEQTPLTTVLIARSEHRTWLDERLRELVELRIELDAWETSETEGFVRDRLGAAGESPAAMTPEAVAQLQTLTGGAPRQVAQLTELALAVREDQPNVPLDPATVLAVFDELSGLGSTSPLPVE